MTVETDVEALVSKVTVRKNAAVDGKATLDNIVDRTADYASSADGAADETLAIRDEASDMTSVASAAATAAASTTSTSNLQAFVDSKSVTAVDVFVYDTSKDSDGGAWRYRTTGTSWYNETLNTTTRGSRKEFPAVAVIVAETTKVTIYDGDDPSLPMWMVFNVTTSYTTHLLTVGNDGSVTSISAVNGSVTVATNGTGANQGVNGVFVISFPADRGIKYCQSQISTYYDLDIARRNTSGNNYLSGPDLGRLVSNVHNDVAMTVLPDAPIDPDSGLPVPTIAVATAGGVSVIKDDGNVFDITFSGGWGSDIRNVEITDENLYFQQSIYYWLKISLSEVTQDYVLSGYGFGATAPFVQMQPNGTGYSSTAGVAAKNAPFELVYTNSNTSTGMLLVGQDASMRNNITSQFNTGWLVGDIQGAWLADTDISDLTIKQIVTDPTFDTGDGWTSTGGGTWTIADGVARCTSGSVVFLEGPFLTTGKAYVAQFEVKNYVSGSARFYNNGSNAYLKTATANGVYRVSFTATDGTWKFVGYDTDDLEIDNVYIWEAEADRSVKKDNLEINGTITRSPVATGAELVGYSGFSTSNYLEQAYNSDLDFGTGDFSIMGWVKTTGQNECILHRSETTGGLFVQVTSGGVIRVYASGNSSWGTSLTGSIVVNSDTWNFVTIKRDSGVLSISVNGEQDATLAHTDDISYVNAVTRVGLRCDGLEPYDNGSLALLRISATAPSADQIKKIYEDERHMFQEGAQCTLNGTEDRVSALAYDEDTKLLHVGAVASANTSLRSTFDGLVRVGVGNQVVGGMISAANGLIVEE